MTRPVAAKDLNVSRLPWFRSFLESAVPSSCSPRYRGTTKIEDFATRRLSAVSKRTTAYRHATGCSASSQAIGNRPVSHSCSELWTDRSLGPDHDLQGLARVHCTIPFRNPVETYRAIEYSAGFDPPFHDIWK